MSKESVAHLMTDGKPDREKFQAEMTDHLILAIFLRDGTVAEEVERWLVQCEEALKWLGHARRNTILCYASNETGEDLSRWLVKV